MTALRRILWALGGLGAGLLIGGFLVGYAAPYLSPTHFWWANLLAVLLPVLSVAVTALGVGVCVWGRYRRSWGGGLAGGALLLLVVVRFGPGLAAWSGVQADASDLRVMTLNVPPSKGDARPPETPFVDLVRRVRPDVLALQESRLTTRQGRPRRVSSSIRGVTERSLGYGAARVLPSAATIQQPVFGRLALDSTSVHPLPPDGATNARSRYTRTVFSWRGRTAVLYNVHLHTVGQARPWTLVPAEWTSLDRWATFLESYRRGALRRAQQARLIRRRLEREPYPVLVVGDFNSTPHQWAFRHLAQGLQSAVTRRVRGWGLTYPARRPLVQIDHVLAGPDWQITAARIPDGVAAAVSDHRPVVAHLRWKPD